MNDNTRGEIKGNSALKMGSLRTGYILEVKGQKIKGKRVVFCGGKLIYNCLTRSGKRL